MIEKEFVLFYNTKCNEYFYVFSKWFEMENKHKIPILYSDDFELIQKVNNELNERLQKQSN